jgi:hypothetical protein
MQARTGGFGLDQGDNAPASEISSDMVERFGRVMRENHHHR